MSIYKFLVAIVIVISALCLLGYAITVGGYDLVRAFGLYIASVAIAFVGLVLMRDATTNHG